MPGLTRTFVAIPVPSSAGSRVEELRRRLEPTLPGARWVASNSTHLTLAFLGDVSNDRLDDVVQAVEAAVEAFASLSLEVRGLGAFPNARRPRVLWAGLGGPDANALASIQSAIARSLRRIGIPLGDERFNAHVTLARFKSTRTPDLTGLIEARRDWSAGSFVADEVVTYASTLKSGGPIYRPLGVARMLAKMHFDVPTS